MKSKYFNCKSCPPLSIAESILGENILLNLDDLKTKSLKFYVDNILITIIVLWSEV